MPEEIKMPWDKGSIEAWDHHMDFERWLESELNGKVPDCYLESFMHHVPTALICAFASLARHVEKQLHTATESEIAAMQIEDLQDALSIICGHIAETSLEVMQEKLSGFVQAKDAGPRVKARVNANGICEWMRNESHTDLWDITYFKANDYNGFVNHLRNTDR